MQGFWTNAAAKTLIDCLFTIEISIGKREIRQTCRANETLALHQRTPAHAAHPRKEKAEHCIDALLQTPHNGKGRKLHGSHCLTKW